MEAVLGIEYYAFAFYVFILVCIIILICRAAFSQYKKQKMFFDEKEAKLLKLYQTVEDAMDEFFDMAAESKSEMDEALKKLSSITGVVYKNSSRLRLSEEIPERNEMAPETVKDLNREIWNGPIKEVNVSRTGKPHPRAPPICQATPPRLSEMRPFSGYSDAVRRELRLLRN